MPKLKIAAGNNWGIMVHVSHFPKTTVSTWNLKHPFINGCFTCFPSIKKLLFRVPGEDGISIVIFVSTRVAQADHPPTRPVLRRFSRLSVVWQLHGCHQKRCNRTQLGWRDVTRPSNIKPANEKRGGSWMFGCSNMRQVKKCLFCSFLESAKFQFEGLILDDIGFHLNVCFLNLKWFFSWDSLDISVKVVQSRRNHHLFNGAKFLLRPDFWKSQEGKAHYRRLLLVQQTWWTVYFEVIFEVKLCRYQSYLRIRIFTCIYSVYIYIYIYDISEMLRS